MEKLTGSTEPGSRLELIGQLRMCLRDLLLDAETLWNQSNDTTVAFRGHLAADSNQAYPILRERFAKLGYTPLLRRQQQFDIVVAIRHVFKSRQTHWGVNLILLLLTICSTTLMGAFQHQMTILAMQNIQPDMNTFIQLFLQKPWLVLTGIPASLTIMGILGAHELAHYFVARSHKLASSLPYFIPLPLSPVGTMGAVIRTHIPWENRQALFDVGIAGPIAGMLVALPIFFIGLLFSPVSPPLPLGEPLPSPLLLGWIEDLVYAIRQVPPGQDIYINTVSYFAWFGLIITGFNLLPVGQLDGGHVSYAVLGRWAQALGIITLIGVFALGMFVWSGWYTWAVFIMLLGWRHPPPLNAVAPLGKTRTVLGILVLFLTLLLFTPMPFSM